MTDQELKEVVALVNKAREVLGMQPIVDLPKGNMGEADMCPLANALGCEADTEHMTFLNVAEYDKVYEISRAWGTDSWDDHVDTPSLLRNFIEEFDDGKLPQYDISPPDPDDDDDDDEGEEEEEEEEEG